jgi:hypothetical protein
MTIARIGPGDLWELHTRHGTLIATGTLYQMICLWARMVRDGWSDVTWGSGPSECCGECSTSPARTHSSAADS